MLKIKDNVDLKELEKYGILPLYCCDEITGKVSIKEYVVVYPKYMKMIIFDKDRDLKHIFYWIERQINKEVDTTFEDKKGCYKLLTNLLYDLIQAGLVEKVEDNE